jgi:hypothetical protein
LRPATASSVASAAERDDDEVGPLALHLRGAADRRGAEAGALRQVLRRLRDQRDESVPDVLALEKHRHEQPLRQGRRHVFRGMNADIDAPGMQRRLDLFAEQAFAANVAQRRVLEPVATRRNCLNCNLGFGHIVCRGDQPADHMGLRQRQRRAARADAQIGGFSGRLRHWTSQC